VLGVVKGGGAVTHLSGTPRHTATISLKLCAKKWRQLLNLKHVISATNVYSQVICSRHMKHVLIKVEQGPLVRLKCPSVSNFT